MHPEYMDRAGMMARVLHQLIRLLRLLSARPKLLNPVAELPRPSHIYLDFCVFQLQRLAGCKSNTHLRNV